MRIKGLSSLIKDKYLTPHTLSNTTAVIDGQNFLYNSYEESKLQYAFGSESDKYAEYLRQYLMRFKEAEVTCYIIFKGGHEGMKRRPQFDIPRPRTEEDNEYVVPIFAKQIYQQVLTEMGFDHTFCRFGAKSECIAFAQQHNCYLIGNDIEFCFSGVRYIPYSSLVYNKVLKSFNCGLFTLEKFLKKFNLTKEKIAIFIVLTDLYRFPENMFTALFRYWRIPVSGFMLLESLLRKLSKVSVEDAMAQVRIYLTTDQRAQLRQELETVKKWICKQQTPGIPLEYLNNGNRLDMQKNDPKWFEKGVASKHIPLFYVDLYCEKSVIGSWVKADEDERDALMLSMEIITYAYNLLTNFRCESIQFISNEYYYQYKGPEPITLSITDGVRKPNIDVVESVFENGWDDLKERRLFENFLKESINLDCHRLDRVPAEAKLLMISLVYFSKKKTIDVTNLVYSILLCYLHLSKAVNVEKNLANSAHKSSLSIKFCNVNNEEAKNIFDVKLYHPLIEFQHCLQQLHFLNTLCGNPFQPTIYRTTFNGTVVYKILYTIEKKFNGNCNKFVKLELSNFFDDFVDLVQRYEQINNA